MALLARSGVGRDINRQHFSPAQINEALQRPVVQDLLRLIRLRNTHPAFNGQFELLPSADEVLALRWRLGDDELQLSVDLARRQASIRSLQGGRESWHALQAQDAHRPPALHTA
jgi:sucrose phosphorylase